MRRIDTSSISLGKIPQKTDVLKDSVGEKIEKLCCHSEWQHRVLHLTSEKLLISHPDEDDIADQIPLVRFFSYFL